MSGAGETLPDELANQARYGGTYCNALYTLHGEPGAAPIRVGFAGPAEALIGIESYLLHDARYRGAAPAAGTAGDLDQALGAVPPCDVILAVVPDGALAHCPGTAIARLPWRINQALVIDQDWAGILRDFSPVERRKQALYQRNGYQLRVSAAAQDFALFFDRYYLPTMQGRHGTTAITMTREAALTEVFAHGRIFWIACGAELLAGVLCKLDEAAGTVHFKLVGTRDGDVRYLKQEALSAAYYFVAEWACANGYRKVDYQLSVPFLRKGIFQFKRKYHATVSVPPPFRGMTLALSARADSPQLRSFLESNPCIGFGADGALVARYFAAPGSDPSRLVPFRCPGLATMQVTDPATLFGAQALQSSHSAQPAPAAPCDRQRSPFTGA